MRYKRILINLTLLSALTAAWFLVPVNSYAARTSYVSSIDFDDVPADKALKELFQKAGVKWEAEVNLSDFPNITLKITKATKLTDILKKLTDDTGMKFTTNKKGAYVVGGEPIPEKTEEAPKKEEKKPAKGKKGEDAEEAAPADEGQAAEGEEKPKEETKKGKTKADAKKGKTKDAKNLKRKPL